MNYFNHFKLMGIKTNLKEMAYLLHIGRVHEGCF
nr:MAG TPA: hypothetical protein [Bacteriophage sp.]